MVLAFARLLMLFALILMPFGVGMAPAGAAAHDMTKAAAMDSHCNPSDQDDKGKASPAMHCGGTCAALPAEASAEPSAPTLRTKVGASAPAPRLLGTELEIATPPPKA